MFNWKGFWLFVNDWYFHDTHACSFFLSSTHSLTLTVWGEEETTTMLRLTSSPFSLSLPISLSFFTLPSFFPRPSLYLPSSTFQTISLRIKTPPPLSCSLSSSVKESASFSQVCLFKLHLLFCTCILWLLHSLFHFWKTLFLLELLTVGLNMIVTQMENSLLLYSRAYWVSEFVIAWNVDVENGFCYLLSSKYASLSISNGQIQGSIFKPIFLLYFGLLVYVALTHVVIFDKFDHSVCLDSGVRVSAL